MRCPKILAALLVALLAPLAAQAFVLYHSPADDGVNPGQPGAIPIGAGNKSLYLYADNGTNATSPQDPCDGTGAGDEICMWHILIDCDPNVTVVNFIGDGPANVVANAQPAFVNVNGGYPLTGSLGPSRLGELIVSATGTGDCTLNGVAWVDTALNANPPAVSVVASACNDDDLDELCNPADPCISFSNFGPGGLADANGDGIPNVCQCGDANQNNLLDSNDLSTIFGCLTGAIPAGTCAANLAAGKMEANNNALIDSNDLSQIFAALGGGIPNSALTCANRPEGTPVP